MPAGKHRGVRVALSVPEGIYNQLDQWAEMEGRPIASLCLSIVETGLRQAVADGVAPSVMQTRVNEPNLDTKPGVSAHKLSDEEHKELMGSGKFTTKTVMKKGPSPEEVQTAYTEILRQVFGNVQSERGIGIKEAWEELEEHLQAGGLDTVDQMAVRDVLTGFKEFTGEIDGSIKKKFEGKRPLLAILERMTKGKLVSEKKEGLSDKSTEEKKAMLLNLLAELKK